MIRGGGTRGRRRGGDATWRGELYLIFGQFGIIVADVQGGLARGMLFSLPCLSKNMKGEFRRNNTFGRRVVAFRIAWPQVSKSLFVLSPGTSVCVCVCVAVARERRKISAAVRRQNVTVSRYIGEILRFPAPRDLISNRDCEPHV